MNIDQKILSFDYFVTSLIKHCYNASSSEDIYDIVTDSVGKCGLSKLKLMKLLFFVTTMGIENWYLLDNVFNNFYAMPYGPVESDIYDNLDNMPNYTITRTNLLLKTGASVTYSLDTKIIDVIDKSILELQKLNPLLFKMGAFDLVELSHSSDSWRVTFADAQALDTLSKKMPTEVIKLSKTYYF